MRAPAGRSVLLGAGAVLILAGVFLPSGVPLLRLGFALEGLLLLAIGLTGVRWPATAPRDRFELPPPEGENVRHPISWLCGITALAAVLRLYRIGSELWLDEIVTIFTFRDSTALEILTVFKASNNHLLNTLSVKAMIAAFGPVEWAVRLPAVLFGVACIPAIYALARISLGQRESLFAALLLAVSYHHIFFSQNARGYTGMLFWSMLGTVYFLKGLTRDRASDWVIYVGTMLLSVATVLYGFFIIAAHVLCFAAACAVRLWRKMPCRPLVRRLLLVWGALALLCLHLYSGIFTEVEAYVATNYTRPSMGYKFLSAEHIRELVRGFSAGFGNATLVGALAALSVMGFGFLLFLRRHTFYAITLVAPLFTTAGFLLARRLVIVPRSFLWGLPVAWIFTVATALSLERWLSSRGALQAPLARAGARALPYLAVAALVALSALALPAYYRTPKQPYRTSLDWLIANRPAGDPIVAAWLAKHGLRFYAPGTGLTENRDYFAVDTADELQKVESAWSGKTIWLLTTFPRALRLEHPDLDRYIRDHYRARKTFPATIGDAEVTVLTR